MKVHRLWLLPIAAALALVAAPAAPQPPARGSFGRGPAPNVVTLNGKEPAVSLLVRPLVMLTRGDVRVEARVARDARNRVLAIAWSSDAGSAGCTQRTLDGEDAPVLHTLDLPSQPAANYLFVASVFNQMGQSRGRTEARIRTPEER